MHNDLGKSGVKKDDTDVKGIIKTLKENYPSILEQRIRIQFKWSCCIGKYFREIVERIDVRSKSSETIQE